MDNQDQNNLSVCVLISCMYQKDRGIVERTRVQTDVVVVNQCDENKVEEWDFTNSHGRTCHAKYISTKERGLSRSRNMAIQNCSADICLICDDDEVLSPNYDEIIIKSYNHNPEKSAILFIVDRKDLPNGKNYPKYEKNVNTKQILQSSSVQVTFKREDIIKKKIAFDVLLGSGSGNGGGEDNKFLLDIKRARLGIYYIPTSIGTVLPGKSLWFKGFTYQYMTDRGWTSRRSLGFFLGILFIVTFAFKHRTQYKGKMSLITAFKYLLKGFFDNRTTK